MDEVKLKIKILEALKIAYCNISLENDFNYSYEEIKKLCLSKKK